MRKDRVVKDSWFTFTTPIKFWDKVDDLSKRKKRLWLISHNQHFDFNVLDGFRELHARGWTPRKLVMESDTFLLVFKKNAASIYVVDSTNYFKARLEDLGAQIGIFKLKVDFTTAPTTQLLEYCKRDVEILSEYFIKFIKWWRENSLGNFSISIAGLAFNAFKHKFMKDRILVHYNPDALDLELKSYRGGRNECFYVGEIHEKLYKLDVNSMYPFVMKYNPYPIKLKKVITNPTPETLKHLLRKYLAIADVHVETTEPAYAVRREKLVFPVGRFRAVLTTPELQYALEHNHITAIYKCCVYEGAYTFKDYVDFFYRLKHEAEIAGDRVKRQFAKLMLNSLYGKFAQRTRELVEIPYPPIFDFGSILAYDAARNEKYKIYFIGGKAYKLERTHKLFYDANIAIASHVTAYARMYLWHLIKTAGINNVYYCDTDSIIVNTRGLENLKNYIGKELGLLKVEGEADHAVFFAPKDYIFGEETKLKGVKSTSRQLAHNRYLIEIWLRTKSLISRGYAGQVIIEDRIKELKRQYDKGIVLDTGRVIPFTLNE